MANGQEEMVWKKKKKKITGQERDGLGGAYTGVRMSL